MRQQRRIQQQVNKAQYRIEGGADFMAHISQKLRFGMIGNLGLLLGFGQVLLNLLAFGNVLGAAHHPQRLIIDVVLQFAAAAHHPQLAIG